MVIIILFNINSDKKEIINSETNNEILIENNEVFNEEKDILYKVDIKGAVKNPNVYEMKVGSRVIDVINASGGLLNNANTKNINLSKLITDEMVIIVYTNEEIKKIEEGNIEIKYVDKYIETECNCPDINNDACISEDTDNSIIQDENINNEINLININTASKEELMTLPKIGESKALEIIEYRNNNNGFKNIEEIKNITGIKDAIFEAIKEYIKI